MTLKFLREPIVHFIVIGLALFIAGEIHQRRTDIHRIVVTPEREAQLANRYVMQFGKRPDAKTLESLVAQDVDEEILFRQGLALKLDQGDEIVRRRIVQKMKFLLEDTQAPPEPSEAQLQSYFAAHAERYATPPQVSFSHIFFSTDEGEEAARRRANAVLGKLSQAVKRAPDLGDPFPDHYDFAGFEPEQVTRVFGRTAFSEAALSAPIGQWVGPIRSGYGWHLLYIDARSEARRPTLAEVRNDVRADYFKAEQRKLNAAAFADLARTFTVVRSEP